MNAFAGPLSSSPKEPPQSEWPPVEETPDYGEQVGEPDTDEEPSGSSTADPDQTPAD